MLEAKKILIGVTGSIAAYKIAPLVRLLIKAGAEVKVIMTAAAADFVTPLTLSTLSHQEALLDLTSNNSWANHVMLGRWADVMLIAPLSCNTLAKLAHGTCDNLLTAVYLSATCPVVVAPAMDEDMWKHPSTKNNLDLIASYGNRIIPVNAGELASGLVGEGRMAEPEQMVTWLHQFFVEGSQLQGITVLITAGPTHEAIDPVRFIGNASSGKMGVALAQEIARRGGAVKLILGPSSVTVPAGIEVIRVTSAAEMYTASITQFASCNWAIMSAAVADYTPVKKEEEKIKKAGDMLTLTLAETKDILKELGALKADGQIVIGFALETNNEVQNAQGKLNSKNADIIVLNSLKDEGAGFGHDTNKVTIFDKKGGIYYSDMKAKTAIAAAIVNTIIKYAHE